MCWLLLLSIYIVCYSTVSEILSRSLCSKHAYLRVYTHFLVFSRCFWLCCGCCNTLFLILFHASLLLCCLLLLLLLLVAFVACSPELALALVAVMFVPADVVVAVVAVVVVCAREFRFVLCAGVCCECCFCLFGVVIIIASARVLTSVIDMVVYFLSFFVFVFVAVLVLCSRLARCLYLLPSLALFCYCWFVFASPWCLPLALLLLGARACEKRCLFWQLLGPRLESAQNEPSEAYSGHFCGQGLKVLKMSLLRPFPDSSGAKAWSAQNEPPEVYSDHFWVQCPKVLKMSLLRPILATAGAKAWKCSKWASWGLFWPLLGPRLENAQNEPFWCSKRARAATANFWSGSKQTLRSNLATPGNGLKQTVQRKVISNWNPHGKGSFKANSSWKGQGCHSPLGVLPNKHYMKFCLKGVNCLL